MLVVSILAPDFEAARRGALEQAARADAIELRLDVIHNPGEAAFRELVRALGKPLFVAVNGPEAFGTFRGSVEERFEILRAAARGGAAFVDVDHRLARALGPIAPPCRRIVSRHEVEGVPRDLERARAELAAAGEPGDVLKFVAHASCGEDGLAMLDLARAHGIVAFASGDAGRYTRVLAPIFGASWTYAAPARVARERAASASEASDVVLRDPGPTAALAATGAPTREATASGATAPGQFCVDELRAQWPIAGPSRSTTVLAVLGNPARHSLSPRLFNAAFRAAEIDATYVAIEPRDFDAFLARCDAPNWRGFSVTAPFKEAAFACATHHDEVARRARAANTLVRAGDRWHASNTDAPAIRASVVASLERAFLARGASSSSRAGAGARDLAPAPDAAGAREGTSSRDGSRALDSRERDLALGHEVAHPLALRACDAQGRARLDRLRIAVIGTGGAARAALVGLAGAELVVVGRDVARREALASEFLARSCSIDELAAQAPDVVVHCTPLGSRAQSGAMPFPASALRREMLVLDAVYRPRDTPLLCAARDVGALAVAGDQWFARQMALQYELFTGARVDLALVRWELATALDEDGR